MLLQMAIRAAAWSAPVLRLLLVLACSTVAGIAHAQSAPVASLDREQVRLGETVTLQVVAEGQNLPAPDFTALGVDFELLGRSTSSQLSIVGGQTLSSTTWSIELEPRRAGILRIPPIPVGTRATSPLVLTVSDVPQAADGDVEDVFLELEITPREPYVHQPVRMVLRLFYAVGLTEGNLREPEVQDATLTRLGQDRNYAAERHGRRYQVVERVFSLRPDRSGAMRVGAAQFQGRAIRGGSRRLMDPGVRVSARTPPESLNVRARPAEARGDWLPARSILLEDALGPDPSAARIGEPLTRTVRMLVEGLALDQLPDIEHPEIAGAQIYADRPVGHGREAAGWPSAEREFRFAIVPAEAGELVLPELRVTWWDVTEDRQREAVLPERRITVVGTPDVAAAPVAIQSEAHANMPAPVSSVPGMWPWISIGLGALWLISLAGWWRTARRAQRSEGDEPVRSNPDPGLARATFQRAVEVQDAGAALSALLAWARIDDPAVQHLGALRRLLVDDAQKAALDDLERGRYARDGNVRAQVWRDLGSAFSAGPRLHAPDQTAVDDALPPLWPRRD